MAGEEQRKRKLERYKGEQRRELPKKITVALVAVLALGGIVAGANYVINERLAQLPSGPTCPGHNHATFRIFVRGEELEFQNNAFDLSQSDYMRAHLHVPDDHTLHLESGCMTWKDFTLRTLDGTQIRPGYLKLDNVVHGGAEYRDSGNETLRFFVRNTEGEWSPKPDLLDYQPRDGEKILISFGSEDEEALRQQMARVPSTSAAPLSQGPDKWPDETQNQTGPGNGTR